MGINNSPPGDNPVLPVNKQSPMNIDCSFPGGNIVVERAEEDAAWVRQDLRDTDGQWFYWCFRVTGTGGKTVRFHFTGSVAIGARGPAVSLDGGENWRWLGIEGVEKNSFVFTFPPESREVFFCVTIPYTGKDWETFMNRTGEPCFLEKGTLCLTRQGRPVEKLKVGCLHGTPLHRAVVTARHHCCETIANFVLEGLVSFVLGDSGEGDWLRNHVEFLVVPFMDREGVEAGDQGKNRKPHDHNRDYNESPIYPETAALKALLPAWSAGLLHVALDLHCPWLKGKGTNETLYLVGANSPAIWAEQQRFSGILEKVKTGSLPYLPADNLPYGTDWNVEKNFTGGKSCARWIGEQEGVALVTTIEVPYANVRDAVVTATSAREFGADLGRAIAGYLCEMKN